METEKSILTREVVALAEHKKLGKLKGLRVDYDKRAISHFVVSNATTGADLALPFDKMLALGDTFMTVQSREDFLASSDASTERILTEGPRLVGLDVFSRAGNRLGVVEGLEFDPSYGNVTKIVLDKDTTFAEDTFMFFSEDFVFVDDGEATAADIRSGAPGKQKAGAKMIEGQDAPEGMKEDDKKSVMEAAAEKAQAGSDEDEVLVEFLIDTVVNDDVESKNGKFKVAKGTKLTKELVAEAQKHDALLLLTMSVEA